MLVREVKHKRASAIITAVILLLFVFVICNFGMRYIDPPEEYGLAVNVLGLPCDPIWRSKEALEMVGPRYFKYDIDYKPL